MKTSIANRAIAATALVLLALGTQAQEGSSPEGLFRNPDGSQEMRIACVHGTCQGTLTASRDPANVGKVVLRDLHAEGGHWKGAVLVPKQGKEFPAEIGFPDPKTLRITVSKGPFNRSRDWTRVR